MLFSTMVLTFDGTSAVSGTVSGFPDPADVKSGPFGPKTGALKLQLGKQGEAAVLVTLEGAVVNGTATGRLTSGRPGAFRITRKG